MERLHRRPSSCSEEDEGWATPVSLPPLVQRGDKGLERRLASSPSPNTVDRRVRTRARRQISRPRCPPTRLAPFLEPRQCPTHNPRLILLSFTLSRALPTPPAAAGDPRPRSRPSSSLETAPSLLELHLEVRHPSPSPISPIALCVRPISPSSVLGCGGPPCSRGAWPI
jgi:hypothetical protein